MDKSRYNILLCIFLSVTRIDIGIFKLLALANSISVMEMQRVCTQTEPSTLRTDITDSNKITSGSKLSTVPLRIFYLNLMMK